VAELTSPVASSWYARHLPAEFVAGNPASRDAALHSIQACIPHKTILPVGVDRIVATAAWTFERATIQAIERVRDGDNFLYDLKIQNATGETCEFWEGLHLRAVASTEQKHPWPLPLLAPYLERKLGELIPWARLRLMLHGVCENGPNIDGAVRQWIGPDAVVTHRPDGKPEILGCSTAQVSLSHAGRLTLMLSGNSSLGCDMEQIASREPAMWGKLLGDEGFDLAKLMIEKSSLPLDTAATLVWTLKESLRKSGASFSQPLRLESVAAENWITLSAGAFTAATFHTRIEEVDAAFAFAFVARKTQ
jgi:enediyne polyketide synthase